MRRRIVFRADGNQKIGLGHLYRVISLIEMLKNNFEILILTKSTSDYEKILHEYNVCVIPSTIEEEINWIKDNFISNENLFLLDGYDFDSEYQKKLKKIAYKIIYIDDFGLKFEYADLVINHSPIEIGSQLIKRKNTLYALGTEYSILRPLFLESAKEKLEIQNNFKVLVCFGGADINDLTQRTVRLLLELESVEEINVILGESYIHFFNLNHPKVKVHKGLNELEIRNRLRENDRVIVPSSTILYEAVSSRKYILSGYYVDNQESIYKGFDGRKTIIGVGNYLELSDEKYLYYLRKLIVCEDSHMLKNQNKMIDGLSNFRILELIKKIVNESSITG
jgi:spore coat polysaccharide biosynthesis predicted glycosyltransferase SpsG